MSKTQEKPINEQSRNADVLRQTRKLLNAIQEVIAKDLDEPVSHDDMEEPSVGVRAMVLSKRNVTLEAPLEMALISDRPIPHWKARLLNHGMECALVRVTQMDPSTRARRQTLSEVVQLQSWKAAVFGTTADEEALTVAVFNSPMPFRIGHNHPIIELTIGKINADSSSPPPTVHRIDLGTFVCRDGALPTPGKKSRRKRLKNRLLALVAGAGNVWRHLRRKFTLARVRLMGVDFYVFDQPERLGHLLMTTLIRHAEDLDAKRARKTVWVFAQSYYVLNHGWVASKRRVANAKIVDMFKRHLNVWDHVDEEDLVSLPKARRRNFRLHPYRDVYRALQNIPPILQFTQAEEQDGGRCMERMGIPQGARFVCIHVREQNYERGLYGSNFPEKRYGYRNPAAANFVKPAEWLAERGYYVVFMGAPPDDVEKIHPRVINYVGKFRTEFMDVWLASRCFFFVGSTSGSWSLPAAFKRPILYTNFFPYSWVHAWEDASMVLFQKVVETTPQCERTLKVDEVLGTPELGVIHLDLNTDFWASRKLVPNSAEDILAAVQEMTERCEGTWIEQADDRALQEAFWQHFSPNPLNLVYKIKAGTAFLRTSGLL